MFLYCISCGFPVERWEIPEEEWDTAASSDRVVMCGDCTLLEYHFFNYFPELVCCDECGRPVEPEDTMEIDSLVVCIECWRPPIISGISDYAHTPPAPSSRGQATRKSRKVKPLGLSRRAAADTDLAVDEVPAQADLPVDESSTQTVNPGEESQPKSEESLDMVKATVPSRPASKPGTTHSQQQQEHTIGSERTSGIRDLEGLSPAGNTNTVKPASQERNGKSGCLTSIALLLLGAFLSGAGLAHLSGAQDKDAIDRSQSALNTVPVEMLHQEP